MLLQQRVISQDVLLITALGFAFQASVVSNGANPNSVTIPAGTVNTGDLLIHVAANPGGGSSTTVPAGFTLLQNRVVAGNNCSLNVSYRIADGTEDGQTFTGVSGGANADTVLLVFRPLTSSSNKTKARFVSCSAALDPSFQETSANPTDQLTTPGAAALNLVIAVAYSNGAVTGVSTGLDASVTSGSGRLLVYFEGFGPSPGDQSLDMGDGGGANAILIFYLELS